MSRGKITMVNYEYEDLSLERDACSKEGYEFSAGHASTEDELIELMKDSDGMINIYARITPYVASSLKQCKVISRTGVGYDMINVAACRENGIEVCYVPDYCVDEVADHAVGLLITIQRKIFQHNHNVKNGIWDYKRVGDVARLNRQTLGMVGLGNIGVRFAAKMKEIMPNILINDPYLPDERFAEMGLKKASFEEILETSDIISLHTPLTPETRHMLNTATFEAMKKRPFIINVSRGGLIDTDAMVTALSTGQIRGAGIDVLENEPEIPRALTEFDNVILTPHAAWYSQDAEIETRTRALTDIFRVLNGEAPRNPVPPVKKG